MYAVLSRLCSSGIIVIKLLTVIKIKSDIKIVIIIIVAKIKLIIIMTIFAQVQHL